MKDTLKLKGTYDFKIIGVDGKVRDEWTVENLVTNAGLAYLTGNSITDFTHIGVGTSTTAPAAGDTTLTAEITTGGLERAAGTVSQQTTTVTNDTYRITYTWTASATLTVEEVGVFTAISGGTMLSHALTGTKTVNSGEFLQGTYNLALSN